MKKLKNKTMATLIAIILVSSMAISLVAIPSANAQSKMTTYAFIGAMPNPIGVGQQTLLDLGITDQLTSVSLGWTGLTVTVTAPDGTVSTLGPFRTDATGRTGTYSRPAWSATTLCRRTSLNKLARVVLSLRQVPSWEPASAPNTRLSCSSNH